MKQDRTSPVFWQTESREYFKRNQTVLAQYREFCRQFRADLSGVPYNESADGDPALAVGYANLTQLQARIMRSDLMFRCPRPQVTPPSVDRTGFTAKLARIETKLLADWVQESDYYREMRRAALDHVLGASCIVKLNVGNSSEFDLREMKKQRKRAEKEDNLFVASGGLRKPRIRKDDRHPTHIEEHARFLAAAERGEIVLPDWAMEILRAHISDHAKAIEHERQTESSRWERVTIRRIHPENFSCDPWAERPYAREWYKERFTARIADAEANPLFDRKAVEAITPCTEQRPPEPGSSSGRTDTMRMPRGGINTEDKHFLCHEVLDMVGKKGQPQVVLYADGGTRPLLVRPWTLGNVVPSGPYEECSMIEDPDECWGVPPPAAGEAHQKADSELFGIMTEAVRRSLPMNFVSGRILTPEAIDKIKNGEIGELIVAENATTETDLSKQVANVPPAEVPRQNFVVQQAHRAMREQMLGLGSARVAGGDDSKTATASAIVNSSVNSLAEDSAANWDDFQCRVLRKVNRYHRAVLPPRQVFEIVGQEALDPDGWPIEGFADRDVANDRNVFIVPGSSRRNESAVNTKLIGELTTAFQGGPLAQLMPKKLVELYQRWAESANLYGVEWENDLQAMLMAQAAAMAGGEEPPPEEGGPKNGRLESNGKPKSAGPRPSEAREPSAANQNGGIQNVGGGRVATGAGIGDRQRLLR